MAGIVYYLLSIKEGMLFFGEIINTLVNSILLSFVYLVGVGLTKIVSKIIKKDFLDTKIEKEKDTYWIDLNSTTKEINSYYRQF